MEKNIETFFADLSGNAEAVSGLLAAVGDKQGLEASQAVADFASALGYSVTAEDASAFRERVIGAQKDDLSDQDLEQVAGGTHRIVYGPGSFPEAEVIGILGLPEEDRDFWGRW